MGFRPQIDQCNLCSDGDGFNDNVDMYLGDMMLHINFNYLKVWEDINNGNCHNIFFALKINNDKTLSTDRLIDVYTNVERYFSMDYYIDASDIGTSMSFVLEAVADNAGYAGDDIKLDIESTNVNTCEYPFTFYFGNGHTDYEAMGEVDGLINPNTDAHVDWYVETVVKPKANTIIINSTDENSGLYAASDGSFRYNADEQVYMLYITTPGSSAHFVAGVNAIVVPRFLALGSQLNDTLTTNPGSSQLAGGSFYSTDASNTTSSDNIVAVIEKSMSNADAEALLFKLTHNSTNAQIGNDVVISQNNIYLLHLPKDIQSRIPYAVLSSSLIGESPNYLSASSVFEFVWNCMVSIGSTLSNLVTNLVNAGISLVCGLVNAYVNLVVTAVNKIVDAFNAFVTWAIQTIMDTINSMLNPILEPLADMWSSYSIGVCSALIAMVDDYDITGSVSSQSIGRLSQSLLGDFYWLCFGVGVAICAITVALTGITNVFGFLVGLIISTVVMVIFQSVFTHDVSSETTNAASGMESYTSTLNSDPSEALAVAEVLGIAPPADDTSISASKWRTLFGGTSFVVGIFAAHVGIASIPSGPGYAYKLGIVSVVASLIAAGLSLTDVFHLDSNIATFGGFWIGIFSLVSGLAGIAYSGGDTFARNVGIAATALGGVSLFFSIVAVSYANQEGG